MLFWCQSFGDVSRTAWDSLVRHTSQSHMIINSLSFINIKKRKNPACHLLMYILVVYVFYIVQYHANLSLRDMSVSGPICMKENRV